MYHAHDTFEEYNYHFNMKKYKTLKIAQGTPSSLVYNHNNEENKEYMDHKDQINDIQHLGEAEDGVLEIEEGRGDGKEEIGGKGEEGRGF